MIKLLIYPHPLNENLLNFSPFSAKTEIFLKMTKIEHEVDIFTGNPGKMPNSKLPVIMDEGKIIADSSIIENYLTKKFQIKDK